MKLLDLARTSGICLSLFVSLGVMRSLGQSDTESATNINWSSASDEQVLLQAIEHTPPLSPDAAPPGAAFYSAQHSPISSQPWPPFPGNVNDFPLWDLGSNVWLIDDLSVDYSSISVRTSGPMMVMGMDGIAPPGSSGGTNDYPGLIFNPPSIPDYGTNMWLQITNVANGLASGWITNSSIYVPYTIYSRPSVVWPIWSPEATFYGSWNTNFTAFSVPMLARGSLFLEARSEIAPHIVGAGNTTFAALRRDSTVWAWGNGDAGQLGDDDWTNTSTPVQVVGLSNVVAIAVPSDGDFTLALDSYGHVWSWGTNGNGQLGRKDGLYENENTPAIIPGLSNIVAIAGGVGHAIGLRSDGTVWAWGDNAYGDLGDGLGVQRDYAAPVPGLTNAIAIVSGDYHCFALCSDGRAWGWGLNEIDELGIGNEDDQATPVLISGLTNAIALAGGWIHSIALLANGTIEAWGVNYFGEIGDINSSTPVPVSGLSNIVSIASGQNHNLFIDAKGNLFAWGNDSYGEFGDDGADWGSATPYLVSEVSNVTAIACGSSSSIISTGNGNIYTFGNSYEYEPAPTLTDLYTNYSSDGSGLPDGWERQYFGHLGIDPNADPVGDGWTLLQDYEQGYNPTNFITPPAITGLTVTQTNVLGNIVLTWNAEIPQPLDYDIYRIDFNYDTWQYGTAQEIGEVAGGITTFTDNRSVPGGDNNSIYEGKSIFSGGSSPFSAQEYVNSQAPPTLTDNIPFSANLIRNGTGRWQIMFSGIPNGIQTIQLDWYNGSFLYLFELPGQPYTTQDIVVSNLVNGVYSISDSDVVNELGDTLVVQGVGPSGMLGQQISAGFLSDDAPYFVDGRKHMEQNLKFLIRAAWLNEPYAHFDGELAEFNEFNTNIEEFSFLHHNWLMPYSLINETYVLDDLWPFEANYNLANNLANISRASDPFGTSEPVGTNAFNFQPNFSTNVPAPPILEQSDPYWILQPTFVSNNGNGEPYGSDGTNWGLTFNPDFTEATLQSGINNLFGLLYETGLLISDDFTNYYYQDLSLGDTIMTVTNYDASYNYATWCLAPTLQFTNYYLVPLNNPFANTLNLPTSHQLPIFEDYNYFDQTIGPGFSPTNQTPAVIFGSVGQPMILGAWAKYSIQSSSPTKYAYLGQYFTSNAWEVDSAGNPTTTNAGIVSPYGEFFPTQPGPAALITMTNLDTGTQATGIVNVISLALDANHDGMIDPTWNGSDFTSPSHPYVFWCNNNFDRWDHDTADGANYMDDVQSNDVSDTDQNLDPNDPDCNYTVSGQREIPDTRDLEDFARLWICGFSDNLIASLPSGCTITLSWGDVENPNPNNPTIDIFKSSDLYGDTEYQTNEEIATEQRNPSLYVGRVSPGNAIQIQPYTLGGDYGASRLIWCGVSNGIGGLTLTLYDANSNVLAKSIAYIQIKDIKQMYERWTVGDDPSVLPTTTARLATNDLPEGASEPFRYANPAAPNAPYILFVHGWNMETWEKDRFAETAFKRLYWQGYQGRFGVFRWPTDNGYSGIISAITDADNYDNSEFFAWISGHGLLNKLNDLNEQYPGNVYLMAHSMGNVVAGEALRQAGTNQLVNTYIAMQGAIPSHCYDPTTLVRTNDNNFLGIGYNSHAPNCYANYWTNGAPCYFNTSAGAGAYVNFFNTNDYALTYWQVDQDLKPDTGFSYTSGGFYAGGTEIYFPQSTDDIFAYCDTAFCYALGQQLNVRGSFSISKQIELDASPYNFGKQHLYHSMEFRQDYPQNVLFWEQFLSEVR